MQRKVTWITTRHDGLETGVVCVALLGMLVLVDACDSRSPAADLTQPSAVSSSTLPVLSGQVFELIPEGRVPAAGISVLAVVATVSGCSAPCVRMTSWTYQSTTTGIDGRYRFLELPAGSATVLTSSPANKQVCGAGVELGRGIHLDVEITSKTNPQRSPTMPPLRITGQIYEMTPAGRVGIGGAGIYVEHHAPDAPFFEVSSDANGRYVACGIPKDWPIAFWTSKTGYVDTYVWHQFDADTTLDVELKRQ